MSLMERGSRIIRHMGSERIRSTMAGLASTRMRCIIALCSVLYGWWVTFAAGCGCAHGTETTATLPAANSAAAQARPAAGENGQSSRSPTSTAPSGPALVA
jgi:uncharacterized transporter YbjL